MFYFIPNALGRAVIRMCLVALLLFVVMALLTHVAFAQEEVTPEPTPVEEPLDPPDSGPIADDLIGGLREFIDENNTQVVMGFLYFLIVAGLRFVLPDTKLDTERIMALMVMVFGLIYMAAQAFGFQDTLSRVLDVGALLGNTATTLLAMLGVAGVTYLALGNGLKIPIIARSQGSRWFHMEEEPKLIEAQFAEIEAEPYDLALAEAIARGVAAGQSMPKG